MWKSWPTKCGKDELQLLTVALKQFLSSSPHLTSVFIWLISNEDFCSCCAACLKTDAHFQFAVIELLAYWDVLDLAPVVLYLKTFTLRLFPVSGTLQHRVLTSTTDCRKYEIKQLHALINTNKGPQLAVQFLVSNKNQDQKHSLSTRACIQVGTINYHGSIQSHECTI